MVKIIIFRKRKSEPGVNQLVTKAKIEIAMDFVSFLFSLFSFSWFNVMSG
jgi:hypothetical protein